MRPGSFNHTYYKETEEVNGHDLNGKEFFVENYWISCSARRDLQSCY